MQRAATAAAAAAPSDFFANTWYGSWWPGRAVALSLSLSLSCSLMGSACVCVCVYLSESAWPHKAKILPLFLACVWVNVCVYVYAGNVSLVCVCAAAFFALPPSATIYRYIGVPMEVYVYLCTHTHVQISAYLRVCGCLRRQHSLMAKYSRRHAPLMVKTCKRHTHTHIPIYKYMCIHTRVFVCVCMSLMGRRLLLFGGKTSTWLRRRLLLLHLATSFANPLAACASRSTAFALRRSFLLCSESSLWLRVKVSEHEHEHSRSHQLLLRMCAADVCRVETPSCCTVLQARLRMCVCVWSRYVCVYTGWAYGNMEGVSGRGRRLKSRFQHKLETLFLYTQIHAYIHT